jgi:hypothetical protein
MACVDIRPYFWLPLKQIRRSVIKQFFKISPKSNPNPGFTERGEMPLKQAGEEC